MKDEDWYEKLVAKAYGVELDEIPADVQFEGKVNNLKREIAHEDIERVRDDVFEGLSEQMEEGIKVVPTSEDPDPEVEEAAQELNDWLDENPEYKQAINEVALSKLC